MIASHTSLNGVPHTTGVKIGVLCEIKNHEQRVALTPSGAETLSRDGHTVLLESGAGVGSGFKDTQYAEAGATIVATAATVWREADLILKVKEPLPQEWPHLRAGQMVFTYFHFAADEKLTQAVQKSGCVAIAYETVQEADGTLPLLVPMSEVAGRMSVQQAAKYLERTFGGRGMLLGGVPGVERARVIILGAGVVGTNAAQMAAGLGADVTLLDVSLARLRYLNDILPANVSLLYSDPHRVKELLKHADVVIGSVLLPGKKAPKLVRRADLAHMKAGAVLVDVAIDQGGCFESSRPTTHDAPTYSEQNVVHYCVTNMPGGVPHTATMALTNATLPYIRQLARLGWESACDQNEALFKGLNIVNGDIVHVGLAEAMKSQW